MKRYRVSSKRCLLSLDHQFQMACGFGLVCFQKKDSWKLSEWRKWPHLSAAMDCGPDNMCGSYALEYRWDFNFDRFPDPSHGGLKAVGLMGFLLSMMVSWTPPYGPDRDHQRMLQIEEALDKCYNKWTAKLTPLFMKKGCWHRQVLQEKLGRVFWFFV